MATFPPVQTGLVTAAPASSKPPFYRVLWVQVLVAMALAVAFAKTRLAPLLAPVPLTVALISIGVVIYALLTVLTAGDLWRAFAGRGGPAEDGAMESDAGAEALP